ncbi:hypothetical protein ACU4GD_08220 [Cupriavidus basilensis]
MAASPTPPARPCWKPRHEYPGNRHRRPGRPGRGTGPGRRRQPADLPDGPFSAAAKDSLLRVLRDKLQDDGRVRIAQRYITRASSADASQHRDHPGRVRAVRRCQHGFRAATGAATACATALVSNLDAWLAQGLLRGVVNGSRTSPPLPTPATRRPARGTDQRRAPHGTLEAPAPCAAREDERSSHRPSAAACRSEPSRRLAAG